MPARNAKDRLRAEPGSLPLEPREVPAGVIGLGLMGTSIIACLLAAGHPVVAVTRSLRKHRNTRRQVRSFLAGMVREGFLKESPTRIMPRFKVSEDFGDLREARLVIESIIENLAVKREVIAKTEAVVSPETVIGSNTSSLPITQLQAEARHPERILGIHWGEPAHVLRFLEIICGQATRLELAEWVAALARRWGKEPSLVRRDIRGFITNRIMYAMLREAFYLVREGYATIADVDRSFRNDYGFWATLAGPFRYMDLTGIPAYQAVMEGLFPELNCDTQVPALMREVVSSGARGIENAQGFYKYTPRQAKRWKRAFLEFSYEIRKLAAKYPEGFAD